jgi:hypothetical protein
MSQVSLPFPNFQPGTTIFSSQVNANDAALAAGINSVDNTQVGPLGFYASQIIPLTSLEATFGGSQSYTFTQTLIDSVAFQAPGFYTGPSSGPTSNLLANSSQVLGPIKAIKGGGISLATVQPFYISGGNDYGSSAHRTAGKVTINVLNGATSASASVTLSNDATFVNEPFVQATLATNVSVPSSVSVPAVPGWTGPIQLATVPQPSTPYNLITILAFPASGSAVSTARLNAYWSAEGT